jgi:hypothetical protein
MKNIKPRTFISLTGGLGNQLFQLAAGMANSKNNLEIITYFGSPRLNIDKIPDLFDFQLPSRVLISKYRKGDVLSQKVVGYLLRKGINPRRFEKNLFYQKMIQFVSEIILSLKLQSYIKLQISDDVGYSELKRRSSNSLLVGYFQTYKWASEVSILDNLKSMKLVKNSKELDVFRKLANNLTPLAVHVRLGDYRNEDSFGLLSNEYYLQAIRSQLEINSYGEIWLFSDELESARSVLPKNIDIPVRLIPMVNNSSAATLEVMRLCKGYVIANSTFSWWGAFLSYTSNAIVFAPNPWFKDLKDPRYLTPPNWNLVNV